MLRMLEIINFVKVSLCLLPCTTCQSSPTRKALRGEVFFFFFSRMSWNLLNLSTTCYTFNLTLKRVALIFVAYHLFKEKFWVSSPLHINCNTESTCSMADPPDSHKRHGISETTFTLAQVWSTNLFLNHRAAGTGGEGLGWLLVVMVVVMVIKESLKQKSVQQAVIKQGVVSVEFSPLLRNERLYYALYVKLLTSYLCGNNVAPPTHYTTFVITSFSNPGPLNMASLVWELRPLEAVLCGSDFLNNFFKWMCAAYF